MEKILMVSSFPIKKCGIAKYTEYLISNLNQDSQNKLQTHKIHFIKDSTNYFMSSVTLIKKIIFRKYRIIHFQYTPTILGPLAPLFLYIAKKSGIKIVITTHESLTTYIKYIPKYFRFLYLFYERNIYFQADKIIVLTKGNKFNLINQYARLERKIHIIPIGIPEATIYDQSILEKKYSSVLKYNIIGFFGFIREGKGIETLIRAYSLLNNKKLALLIAGNSEDFSYLKKLQRLSKRLKLENVFWYGFLPQEDMDFLMSKCKCVALPYKKNTNSAILANIISAETPIVGTNIGSIKEYLENFDIGLQFPVDDEYTLSKQIARIAIDQHLANKIKTNMKKLKSEYSWKKVSFKHKYVYSSSD